jgi:hypothetical protein
MTSPGRAILLTCGAFVLHSTCLFAGTKQVESKIVRAPEESEWRLKLALPAWIATTRGDTGVGGNTSHSNTGFNEIVNKVDMAAGLRAELWKGHFGVLTDFSNFSISDSIGVDLAIRKVDIQADQMLGDLGLAWRIIDSPRGTLEIIGGVRYTYLHEYVKLQGDDRKISAAADRLAIAGPALRRLAEGEFEALRGRDGQRFSRPNLTEDQREKLVQELSRIRGERRERAERIEKALRRSFNQRISRTDQWLDPYFGVRGRYNFSNKIYVLGRADVSPFDVGADFAWQASAGFGLQLSSRVSYEVVYRILDVDYRHDGLIYDETAHGPEATLAITF